jgi:hypothetical protein
MPDPRKKIQLLISSLEELRLHVGRKDLAVGNQKVNAMLFFSLANARLQGRCLLLYGGIGANKTTLVNLLGSSFLSRTLDEVEDLMVTGHKRAKPLAEAMPPDCQDPGEFPARHPGARSDQMPGDLKRQRE